MNLASEMVQINKWCGQKRNLSGGLIADHVIDTAKQIEIALKETGEGNKQVNEELILAALGHDLFEDTEVSREEVVKRWGSRVVTLIDGLTNLKGDNDFDGYIRGLSVADEKIVLVKYADILSNLNNSIERVDEIDGRWMTNFWIPLLNRYERELLPRKLTIFAKTGRYLVDRIVRGVRKLDSLTTHD